MTGKAARLAAVAGDVAELHYVVAGDVYLVVAEGAVGNGARFVAGPGKACCLCGWQLVMET